MPYSSVDEIPASVKKRIKSAKKRRQWMHVFNSTHSKTGDESRSFAAANAVVSRKEDLLEASKSYLYDSYQVEAKRIPQEAAGYDPYGATGGAGCASCHWFVAPSACVLVSGDISPTGKSNMYASASDMRETIMDSYNDEASKPSMLSRIVSSVRKALSKTPSQSLSPFVLFRENEDRLRFMAVYSNIFEDKHNQILTTESHKEYVDWVSESKLYPDLQVWHCGDGSKIGKADVIDFVDGFAVASGVIDSNKEEIAYKAAESDPGVSHGFVGLLQNSTGLWNKYRSFEISVLPEWAAGNENLDVLYAPGSKEFFMPFDPKKRAYLSSLGISEEDISNFESAAKEQSDNLKAMNIAHKSLETEKKPDNNTENQPKPDEDDKPPTENEGQRNQVGLTANDPGVTTVEPNNSYATKSELSFFVKSFAESNTAITTMAKTVTALAESIKNIQNDVNTLKKPADQRAADEWHARASATPGGFIASQQKANKTDEEENQAADDFFGTVVMAQVNKTLGIGG
jgi:hypothetical protein